jgi:hypothetical protein
MSGGKATMMWAPPTRHPSFDFAYDKSKVLPSIIQALILPTTKAKFCLRQIKTRMISTVPHGFSESIPTTKIFTRKLK